eukprot:COSAG02_NODE_801_length_17030_cov_150.308428_1_plen_137_part_00
MPPCGRPHFSRLCWDAVLKFRLSMKLPPEPAESPRVTRWQRVGKQRPGVKTRQGCPIRLGGGGLRDGGVRLCVGAVGVGWEGWEEGRGKRGEGGGGNVAGGAHRLHRPSSPYRPGEEKAIALFALEGVGGGENIAR